MNIPIKNITDVPTPTANTAYIFVDKSDNNLKIKKQSEVVTYIPGEDTSDATVTVNDVLAPKIFYGKDGKQVGAIPTVTPTKTDTLLSIPSGFLQKPYTLTLENSTDLSFVTATSETILKDYISVDEYGNQITGTIPTVTPTLEENTFTVSKGYVESDTTLSIKRCSVESENNTVILEAGFYTAQTFTIGTAKAAETYIPTTNDQIIDSNLFLTGPQIIKGDANLASENIVKGKTIFGVDGAANTQETFYKCAEVIEATSGDGYIISGCQYSGLNGTYVYYGIVANGAVTRYENEDGCYLDHEVSGSWFILDNMEHMIWSSSDAYPDPGNPIDVVWASSSSDSGYPVVTEAEGKPASWSGYLANTDNQGNWTYSSDLTTDLTYSTITPEVGKIYNEDATIVINPESGSTDLSFITASSDKILAGYVGADTEGNPVSGTITVKSSEDVMIIGGTVEVPPGYYNGVSKSIPVGNVSINHNIVTVSEGYVYDKTLEVGAAINGGTLIPTTYDIAYPAYSFLTEGLTIKGDENLKAENIAAGKTIFGVAGMYSGGTDLSFITAGAGQILEGYIGSDKDGNQITGNIQIRSSNDVWCNQGAGSIEIAEGYYSEMLVKQFPVGEVTFSGNVVTVKSGWVSDNTFEVGTSSETDLSFVTAGANQILEGYTGVDKDGNPVSGTITVTAGGTYTPGQMPLVFDGYINGTLIISGDQNLQPRNIKAGEEIFGVTGTYEGSGYDTSDATAIAGFVMDGYTFYGMSGKETGTLKVLSTSDMGIMEGAMLGIPATRYVDNAVYSLTDIHGIGDLSPENIVKGKTIAGIEGTHECPENSGSSMEIFKCAEVVESSTGGYIVSNCGNSEFNGTYTLKSTNSGTSPYSVYENEIGSQLIIHDDWGWTAPYFMFANPDNSDLPEYQQPVWLASSWSTAGDITSITGWDNLGFGTAPAPTITAAAGEPSWNGYKYNTDTKEFAETLTEGLEYKMAVPIVGKCYNSDATMLIDLYAPSGLVFYAPLHEQKATDETGLQLNNTGATFTTQNGVKCAYIDGTTHITASDATFPSGTKARTLSLFIHLPQIKDGTFISYGISETNKRFSVGVESDMTLSVWGAGNTVNYPEHALDINKWYHVCATYAEGQEAMFLDGILLSNKSHANINTVLNELCIGATATAYQDPMIGYISEVKVWNRALSADEIKAEADRCLALVDSGSTGSDSVYGSKLQFTAAGPSSHNGVYVLEDESKTGTDRVWVREGSTDKIFYVGYMVSWVCPMDGGPFYAEGNADSNPWDVTWGSGVSVSVIDTESEQNPDLGGDDAGGSPTITFDGIYDSSGNKVDSILCKYGDSRTFTLKATASNGSACTFMWNDPGMSEPPGVTVNSNGIVQIDNFPVNMDLDGQAYAFKISADGCEDLETYVPFTFQSCVHPDSLILMTDGTEKAIKDIAVGESVMSINQETGAFEPDIVLKNEYTEQCIYPVQDKWTFSDGTELITLARHRIFNVERKAFVYMDEWTIGEHARKADGSMVELVSHEVINEPEIMCTIRLKNNTYVVNGLLTGTRNAKALTPFEEVE